MSRGSGYTLFLTPTEAVLALSKPQAEERPGHPRQAPSLTHRKALTSVLRMKLLGASAKAEVRGLEELPGKSNYFIGNDPKKWRTNVASYAKVEYKEIYPGVDLVYYGNQRHLEHDFILAPGANPSGITLELKGAGKLSIDSQGDLVWATVGGKVRLQKPVVYQEVDGARREIAGSYALKGKHRVGFELGAYDASMRLVIDPVLSYSTYLGGSGFDEGLGIAVDSSGNAYVTGVTTSTNFPGANSSPIQSAFGGFENAFVAKLNAAGSALVYSTYLGGSGSDEGNGIAVDSSGNAYVTGPTTSTNFPTANAFHSAFAGGVDAFVAKLNAAGSTLVYSTYLGGSGNDVGFGIAVDSSGNAYVTGSTDSTNFPGASSSPIQSAFGGIEDAFVAKLNAAGSALLYSTYLGGSGFDEGLGIAVDSSGNAYVTGGTFSTNFPGASSSPIQSANGGGFDAFVAKLDAAGSTLVYSTYLGGIGFDEGLGIAVDSSGNAYVTGRTASTNFRTANAFQSALSGSLDAFVAKLNAAGTALVYSTYLGGSNVDFGFGIAVDSSGNAYVTGGTNSTDFPGASSSPIQSALSGSLDAFVAKLNAAGSALLYSTYLGGIGLDRGSGIAVDSSGNAYVTGLTGSANFPTANAFQSALSGSFDAFVAKINPKGPADLVNDLVALVQSFNLAQGIANSLDVKLQDAIAALIAGDRTQACSDISNFISQVSDQSGVMLTVAQATQLITAANQIRAALGCP